MMNYIEFDENKYKLRSTNDEPTQSKLLSLQDTSYILLSSIN